jgi:Cdc6-like AAA superfamily ATPase
MATATNSNPTNDQLLQVLKSHMEDSKNEQFLVFIHGGPGLGKTWTVNEFKNMLSSNNEKYLCTAFTGNATSLLSGGETIHSLFQFYVGKKPSKSY